MTKPATDLVPKGDAAGSKQAHTASGHGSVTSYVVGFILSLIYTILPYNLVVKHSMTSTKLLAVIVGIAVLQMIIQVVFFLHLGRERKPRWQLYFFIGTVGGVITVVGGSIFIMHHLHYNMMPPAQISKNLAEDEGISQVEGQQTGACKGTYMLHKVTIHGGVVSPQHVDAAYCDRLVLVNEDDQERDIAFGAHPHHGTYGGETELTLRKGRAKTLILNYSGTYQFHDHLDPSTNGSFTVGLAPQE